MKALQHCLWRVGLLLLWAWPALAADAASPIPPGHEAEVLALLAPYADDAPVAGDVKIAGIRVSAARIVIALRSAAGEDARVVLTPALPPAAHDTVAVELPATSVVALRTAQQMLQRHLAGRTFAPFAMALAPRARPLVLTPARDFAWPAPVQPLVYLSVALWLLLAVTLLRCVVRSFPATRQRWQLLGGSLLVFVVAAHVRLAAPFWPLHSNGHWSHDAGLALRAGGVATEAEAAYGAAWVIVQQAGVLLFGVHIDGLARLSVLLGALAAAMTFAAALLRVQKWPWALLGGLLAALAPVAVRVGHSESPFVVAQLLFAIVLLLAAAPVDRWRQLGLAAALALLALGHPLGPGFALGALLLALAWTPPPEPPEPPAPPWRAWALPLLALLLLSLAQLYVASGTLARRVEGDWRSLGFFNPRLLLWTDDAWLPRLTWLLVALGCVISWRRWASRHERWKAVAFALGAIVLIRFCTLANACVSDGLRYQSLLAAPLGVLVASGGLWHVAGSFTRRRITQACAGMVALAVLWQLASARDARQALDTQGQLWSFLRQHPPDAHGQTAHFLIAHPDSRFLMLEPVGRWGADGPVADVISLDVARALCARNGQLPEHTWMLFEPGCMSPGAGACALLAPFAGEVVARGSVSPLSALPQTLRGEFLDLPPGPQAVRVVRVGCSRL